MTGRERHPGDRLAALVDGRLAEPDRTRVVEHLTGCPECLAEYDAQLALKGLLGGLGAPGAPADLTARLVTVPVHEPAPAPTPSRRATRLGLGAAAGAVSVLALGGLAFVVGGAAEGTSVVPPADQYLREHAAVSVSVPLTQPVLQQLVPQRVPMMALPTVAPAHRSLPPAAGR